MKHTLKTLRFAAVLLLVTLVAVACNPDSGSGSTAGGADTGVIGANDTVPPESPAESPEPAPAREAEATEDAPAATESEDVSAAGGDADAGAASDTEAAEETGDAGDEDEADETSAPEDTEATEGGIDAANADDTDDMDDADETADAATGECFVHLYDSDDFDDDDDSFRLEEPGRYGDLADLPDAGKDWDDEADSMQVGADARVTTWSEADFGGDSTEYGPGNHASLDPAPRSLELTCG